MHSIVIIDESVLYKQVCTINFKVAKRLDLNCSHHKKDNYIIEVWVTITVVILVQYINIANQHFVHIKLTKCTCQLYLKNKC